MLKLVSPKMAIKLCKNVESIEVLKNLGGDSLFKEMLNVCIKNQGIGLAAPQVGIYYKFFIAKLYQHEPFKVYVNPIYRPLCCETIDSIEGCLTYGKDKTYKVKRHVKILAEYQEIGFDGFIDKTFALEDLAATIFQHETDHINSITIAAIGEPL
jgi:peptide deformylase